MMQITFVDTDGTEGVVRSDMTLRYGGRLYDEIATFIEGTLARSEDSSVPTPRLQEFAIELYTRFPLSELVVVDEEGSSRSDSDRSRNGARSRRTVEPARPRGSRSERRS